MVKNDNILKFSEVQIDNYITDHTYSIHFDKFFCEVMCGICISVQPCSNHDAVSENLLKLLRNRGPDISSSHLKIIPGLIINFYGQVLHLRGPPTKQPLVDTHGNILLWNGEVFSGSLQVSNQENDGKELLKKLSELDVNQTKERIQDQLEAIFQEVHGPWAFIYYQKHLNQLWFGRDFFGRRSLLWHLPESKSDGFLLSSVAPRSSELTWLEVPAGKLYVLSVDTISNFYEESNNGCKFEDYLTYVPLRLPKKDYSFLPKTASLKENKNTLSTFDANVDSEGINNTDNCCFCCEGSSVTDVDAKTKDIDEQCSNIVTSENLNDLPKEHMDTLWIEKTTVNDYISLQNEVCDDASSQIENSLQLNSKTCGCVGKYNETAPEDITLKCLDNLHHTCISSDTTENPSSDSALNSTSIEGNQIEQNNTQQATIENTQFKCSCPGHMTLQRLSANPPVSEARINKYLLYFFMVRFMEIMKEATRKRVFNLPRHSDPIDKQKRNVSERDAKNYNARKPKVGILFSGGIDSIVIAAIADRCIPEDEPIDLINVAFEQQVNKAQSNNRKKHTDNHSERNPYDVPDRLTGKSGIKELNPRREWNFIEVNVTREDLIKARKDYVSHLVHPLTTVLDDSIGCAIWFAARGRGICYKLMDNELVKIENNYISPVKVLLTGMGADEQLGGYARHRSKFENFGWDGLEEEIQMEIGRISSRNLGRDDRCISDHGREARFPFLDENVVSFLQDVPVWIKCDPRLPRGQGEKRLLRQMAKLLNLGESANLPKRAIQFGSRIAKLENSKEKGSDCCNRLAHCV